MCVLVRTCRPTSSLRDASVLPGSHAIPRNFQGMWYCCSDGTYIRTYSAVRRSLLLTMSSPSLHPFSSSPHFVVLYSSLLSPTFLSAIPLLTLSTPDKLDFLSFPFIDPFPYPLNPISSLSVSYIPLLNLSPSLYPTSSLSQ